MFLFFVFIGSVSKDFQFSCEAQPCFCDLSVLHSKQSNPQKLTMSPIEIESIEARVESVATILSSTHGRRSREERNIAKLSLEACVRFGKRELSDFRGKNGERRWIYTFSGVSFVTNFSSTEEVTSWAAPGYGIDIDKVAITKDMRENHNDSVAPFWTINRHGRAIL